MFQGKFATVNTCTKYIEDEQIIEVCSSEKIENDRRANSKSSKSNLINENKQIMSRKQINEM